MSKNPPQSLNEQGISLLLTILIMALVLGVVLGISTILLQETRMTRDVGNSVIAFYAAETGMEQVLVSKENPSSPCIVASPCSLGNEAVYYLLITPSGPNCSSQNYCIKSFGIFKETRRGIEVNY